MQITVETVLSGLGLISAGVTIGVTLTKIYGKITNLEKTVSTMQKQLLILLNHVNIFSQEEQNV